MQNYFLFVFVRNTGYKKYSKETFRVKSERERVLPIDDWALYICSLKVQIPAIYSLFMLEL
jgi:hypothetical protein